MDPSKEQAAAREQVMKSEQEIQSIKAALRKLGTAENADAPNSVEICMLKVCMVVSFIVVGWSFYKMYHSSSGTTTCWRDNNNDYDDAPTKQGTKTNKDHPSSSSMVFVSQEP